MKRELIEAGNLNEGEILADFESWFTHPKKFRSNVDLKAYFNARDYVATYSNRNSA